MRAPPSVRFAMTTIRHAVRRVDRNCPLLSKQELLEQNPRLCECCLAVNCGFKKFSKRSTPELQTSRFDRNCPLCLVGNCPGHVPTDKIRSKLRRRECLDMQQADQESAFFKGCMFPVMPSSTDFADSMEFQAMKHDHGPSLLANAAVSAGIREQVAQCLNQAVLICAAWFSF